MGINAEIGERVSRPKTERPATRLDPEILKAIESADEGNAFYYDELLRPIDMVYEWKRLTYGGKEDTQYQASLARKGWRAVPASRHPEVGTEATHESYKDHYRDSIIIGGQLLMERHKEYSARAQTIVDRQNAEQIGSQRDKLQQSDDAYMPRKVTAFKQTYDSGQDID